MIINDCIYYSKENFLKHIHRYTNERGAFYMLYKDEIMTVQEFSEYSGLRPYVIRRLIKEKRLVFFMSGRRAYINVPESSKILWKNRQEVE